MTLNDQALLWNQAFIKIIDVRHTRMEQGEELHAYRMRLSVFLYVTRGSAQLQLDGVAHRVSRFSLLHGGKGFYLDITADELLEYYIILYKTHFLPMFPMGRIGLPEDAARGISF